MSNRYFDLFSLILLCIGSLWFGVRGATDSKDVGVFIVLKSVWGVTVPPSWTGLDPCGSQWDGVSCAGSRVISLTLSSMGLNGTLPPNIGYLTALETLDLSYNKNLTGTLPSTLGNLVYLRFLIVIGCGFSGQIPSQLGSLLNLNFLALNSNKFTGPIPSSLGNLVKVCWLDLADNQLTGSIPVSNSTHPGLDKLFNAKNFNFNQNNLSGTISPALFVENMTLSHVLFDSNNFEGVIPSTLGLVKTLQVLRLDRNSLTGSVPSNISDLQNLEELNLAYNLLVGSIPDLSGLTKVEYIDLSNNFFNPSNFPLWMTTLEQLTTIVLENCSQNGEIPPAVFNLPKMETVRIKNNRFSGNVVIDRSNSSVLELVDLRGNKINSAQVQGNVTLWIDENPLCNPRIIFSKNKLCQSSSLEASYETNMAQCGAGKCSGELKLNPKTCQCKQPYKGQLQFRAPSFSSLTDIQKFQALEMGLETNLTVEAVHLCCMYFESIEQLIIPVQFFPSGNEFFTRSEITQLGLKLGGQVFEPPQGFGPYVFVASPYIIGDTSNSSGLRSGVIAGIAVGAFVLALAVLVVGFYALRKKKIAENDFMHRWCYSATCSNRKFQIDDEFLKNVSGVPNLLNYRDLRKATNNFSKEIGKGGFGSVFHGILRDGREVAVKRLNNADNGLEEFTAEVITLASLNHSNLVRLYGLCIEGSHCLLVFEFMENGSLHDWLFNPQREPLDWKTRHCIALQTARGLAYLHEESTSRILHLDVKPQNILLDENFNAKVSDFGLARLLKKNESRVVTVHVRGTPGYIAPEWVLEHGITSKTDVYSYGMVLLEMVSGRRVVDRSQDCEQWYFPSVALSKAKEGKFAELYDSRISVSGEAEVEMKRVIKLALWCIQSNSAMRPSMASVVQFLEGSLEMLDPPLDCSLVFDPSVDDDHYLVHISEDESKKIAEK